MFKNPHVDKKTNNSVQKCPPIKDTKNRIVQKKSQVVAPSKPGQEANFKPTNASLRK
jgi:hypothetical protein